MADDNDKSYLEIGYKFESEDQVTPKVQRTLSQIGKRVSLDIGLGLDVDSIKNIASEYGKISKQSATVFDSGASKVITDINIGLAQTVRLQERINAKGKESSTFSVTDNSAQATKTLYSELNKLQETEFKIKNQMISAEGEELDILKQQLSLTNQLQSNMGKSIAKNELQDEQQINSYQLKRITLTTQLNKTKAEYNDALKESVRKAKEEEVSAKKLADIEKQRLNNKLNNYLLKNPEKETTEEVIRLKQAYDNLSGKSVKEVREETKKLGVETDKVVNKLKSQDMSSVTKTDDKSWFENIKSNIASLGIYFTGRSILTGITNTFRDATQYVISLDSAMIDLKKVTDETTKTYDTFLDTMHNVAMALGTQTVEMVKAVTLWAKTGESLKDSSKLAESTIMLSKVGDNSNVEDSMQYMIAPLKAFNIEAENSIDLIDKYNNVSNNMATSTTDLGEGLSRSASSMAVAGNTLDQTIALLAVAESQTKLGGETIGNA